ncbi:aminotransferase class V-fold PLP-dependent enzyme [[Mycoplasma] anseris]|uniref:Aminotransferase class V-fold PLP-dependent enzyme n=1 Tax=[Mycoplasma] anseris TaxID=92400 RepID=A0A2Z4NEA6_9BACT|nr:aminotransferase class V-fold PLP-dependent enzyme [[Mycoplasma] anseris]AWX69685.1 aminotransferase class V-fold PLP-dependent enzyme [[Mycoplasma] anseris]
MNNVKNNFPMFKNHPDIVYFDNSALTFKPQMVIDEGNWFYQECSFSTRTSDSLLGMEIIQKFNYARKNIANIVDASEEELIFTSGTTESLNLIARMLKEKIEPGEIILSYFNHNSNIVPFFENFPHSSFKFIFVKNNQELLNNINSNTRIIAIPEISNNFDVDFNMAEIYLKAKQYNAILINDAAQAIVHKKVSLKHSDVIAFSGNKIYGPMGTGALVVKKQLLDQLKPVKWGGGQVQDLNLCSWNPKPTIAKFEPGTPNLPGIFQFSKAIDFVRSISYEAIQKHEKAIADYLYDELNKVNNVQIDSQRGSHLVLFNIKNWPAQDVASYLGHHNIYVRSGVFCAHSFREIKKYQNSYIRVSIAFYNTKEDVDKLIETLIKSGGNFLEFI